jgi:DNA helicase HerA-like ATPase
MADIKGDLTGMSNPGTSTPAIKERVASMKLKDFSFEGFPTRNWDVFGEDGEELKVSMQKLTPLLLGRLLNLSDVQTESLAQLFKITQDYSNKYAEYATLEINTIEDLTTTISQIINFSSDLEARYGKISKQSYTSIQRSTLMLEQNGKDVLFSSKPFDIRRFMQTENGRGVINIFKAQKLYETPTVYSTFLLWMIAELYRVLPECGDLPKPKMVFFFDEAHLLFDGAPKVLVDNIARLVRLIRSKGVGIFFITQNPSSLSDSVLSQLSNRIIHSMRAYTPKEQKAVRTLSQTFRQNNKADLTETIMSLKIGEAIISFLDTDGAPCFAKKALVAPPRSRIN